MVKTLILNSSNVVNDGTNSTYEYKFPTSAHFESGDQIAVQSIMLPYSWFNITSSYNNNLFYYVINGTQYAVEIPNGFYDITAINTLLQQKMISNGHYLLDKNGDYYTFIQFRQNITKYANEIDCFPIPPTLQTGFTNPANIFYNTITFGQYTTPQIYIPSNKFVDLVGFKSGYYPPTVQTTTYFITSNTVPNATPVNAIVMTTNIVDNKYSNPSNIFYTFSPNNTSFGSNIYLTSTSLAWVDITVGNYQSIKINFLDQNYNTIYMNDYNICIQLLIKNKNEY